MRQHLLRGVRETLAVNLMALAKEPPIVQYLLVREVRVQDFRALRHLVCPLAPLTVLVGENSVGKTSFLQALDVAIGGARATEEDLHIDGTDVRAPRFVIDIKVTPHDGLEFDDAIRERIGAAIQLPAEGPEYFTIRTVGSPNPDGSGLEVERRFVAGWGSDRDGADALPLLERLNRRQLELLSFYLLDARRDLVEQLRARGSHWGRLMADVGISDDIRTELETALRTLGGRVVDESGVLTSVRNELIRIKETLGTVVGNVSIAALPNRIAEITRSMDVLVAAPLGASLPMRLQGMGARSLAAVMVFQSFVRMRLGAAQDVRPLAVVGFEEPEGHLHPQAHRAIFELIRTLPGQTVVSTHSPYVARVARIFDIRTFRRVGADIVCSYIPSETAGQPTFSVEELSTIERFVQRNHGEMLFARAVIIFEGDTEDGALPRLARAYLGVDPGALSLSLIRAEGALNFKNLVRALDGLKIPWLILADGDAAGKTGVENVGKMLNKTLNANSSEIVQFADGDDFEQHLIREGFAVEIDAAVAKHYGDDALANYKARSHGQPYKNGSLRDYNSVGGEDRLRVDFCRWVKGSCGAAIADEIIAAGEKSGKLKLPSMIEELLRRVKGIVEGTE